MRFIKDGNFTPAFRILLWALGIAIAAVSYKLLVGISMFIGLVIGMITTAVGTYSEMANLHSLKPFDDSYKKAKKTYEKNRNDLDKS